MGWREREWARFTDEERSAIYGGTGATPRSAGGPAAAARASRTAVWSVVGFVALAVAVLAVKDEAGAVGIAPSPAAPSIVFGDLPRPNAAIPATSPGGSATVCTEAAAAGDEWRCVSWTILVHGARARQAAPFDGPCTHRVVDQTAGRWVCTAFAPATPQPLPPPVVPPAAGSTA